MFPEAFVPSVRAVASVAEKKNEDDASVLPSRVIFARCDKEGFKDEKGRSELMSSRSLLTRRYLDTVAPATGRADRRRAELG